MKILQLSHKVPYPPLDGGSIVIHSLTKGLLSLGHRVKVLSIISPKREIGLNDIDENYKNSVDLGLIKVDTRIKPLEAAKNLFFQKESYHTSRFNSKSFSKAIEATLKKEEFDIIQLESIFVLNYLSEIRKHSKAKIVLRTQNIEHLIWEGLIENEKNPLKKWYLKILTKRLKAYELEQMALLDGVIPITDYDADYLQRKQVKAKHLKAIPFGLNLNKFLEANDSDNSSKALFHLGSMDWRPNLEAVDWFLNQVWLKSNLHEKTSLYLAGKFMPERIKNLNNDQLIVQGKIDFPIQYMADKKIMIVPLLSGSGIRVKIIEGMAMGKVIISTSKGATGIIYTPNKHLLIADTPEEFQKAILKCLEDEAFCNDISQNAQQLVKEEYGEIQIAKKFIHFYEDLLCIKQGHAVSTR